MNKIIDFLRNEPAISAAFAGAVTSVGLALAGVIELAGGELVAVIGALAGAGGITRQNVTPTAKT